MLEEHPPNTPIYQSLSFFCYFTFINKCPLFKNTQCKKILNKYLGSETHGNKLWYAVVTFCVRNITWVSTKGFTDRVYKI